MLDQFIEQLLKERGLPEDLDPEVRQQLVSGLKDRAIDLINRRMVESMNDNQIEEFNKILDREPAEPSAVQEFIEKNVENKEAISASALAELRNAYLGSATA